MISQGFLLVVVVVVYFLMIVIALSTDQAFVSWNLHDVLQVGGKSQKMFYYGGKSQEVPFSSYHMQKLHTINITYHC